MKASKIGMIKQPKPSDIAQQVLFSQLWRVSEKRSIVSGLWLREYERTPLFPNCFLYVLPAKEFPLFRFYGKAYAIVTPGEKALYDQCTPESLIQYALTIEEQTGGKATANWDAVKAQEATLRLEYKRNFPSVKGMIISYVYPYQEIMAITARLNKEFFANLK